MKILQIRHLRKVLDVNKNQVLIWQEIAKQLGESNIPNKSSAYLSRKTDKKMLQMNDEYFHFFKQKFKNSDSAVVGFCMHVR